MSRQLAAVIVALLFAVHPVAADDHWADFSVGGSASTGSVIGALRVAVNKTVNCERENLPSSVPVSEPAIKPDEGNCWTVLADFNGLPLTSPETRFTTSIGARYDFPRRGRRLYFAQWLVGGARTNVSGPKNGWRGALTVGAGLDWTLTEPEVAGDVTFKWVKRATVEVVVPAVGDSLPKPYFRFSLGLALRYYKKDKR